MEDTLGVLLKFAPYLIDVLILVLMEDTLGATAKDQVVIRNES